MNAIPERRTGKMDNIVSYVETNLRGMAQMPFSAVDSLVLSKFSYTRFERMVPQLSQRAAPVRMADLLRAEMFDSMFQDAGQAEDERRFLFALAASPRFRDVRMNFYASRTDTLAEKQFAAVTYFLEDKTAYVAFRGTDSSFVGWKEDFNMAYMSAVPSQVESVAYLNAAARRIPRWTKIRIGGHSKGGNLAVYSAVNCKPSVQRRIAGVYNHDGPGFKENIFERPEYLKIKDRIRTTLPEASLVGLLLQHHEDFAVVRSTSRGIAQHDPFSWCVENGDFCYADGLKDSAVQRDGTLHEWLSTLTDEKRRKIVDTLFQVIGSTEAGTFGGLAEDWQKSAAAMLGAVLNIDPESKKFILQTMGELAKLSLKNLFKPKKYA
jgi:hypothetical protein